MHSPFADARFVAMAHRGGCIPGVSQGRENTLVAFTAAVQLGYRFLETDVHSTRDGHLIAFHDDRLDRVSDAHGLIADLTLAQVRAASVAGEQIPTLDEVLDSCPDAVFNIDIKAATAIGPLVRTLAAHRAEHRVCVGSFSSRRLQRFRQRSRGRVATSVGAFGVAYGLLLPGMPGLLPPTGVAYQVPLTLNSGPITWRLVTPASIRDAHRAGRAVHVWTINDTQTMSELIDAGVDGLITDNIAGLAQVLLTKGLSISG